MAPTATVTPKKLYEPCPFCGGNHPSAAASLPPDFEANLQDEVSRVIASIYDGNTIVTDAAINRAVGELLMSNVIAGFGKVSSDVDFTTPDFDMLARLTRDTWQFSSAKNYQQMRDITLALVDENGKLRSFAEFKQAAEEINAKYNKNWLLTEYSNAVGASTMASQWATFTSNAEEMPFLKYQTVGDARVRNEHKALDGIVRKIDDAFWATHYPPNGWNCRCDVQQLANSRAKETDRIPAVPINPMFRTNLAKDGLIYPKNHPYYDGVPQEELRKAIAYLPADATYQTYKVGKGTVDISMLHYNKSQQSIDVLKDHAEICNNLIDLKFKNLKLLPDIHEKDSDIKSKFYPPKYKMVDSKKNPDLWMQTANGQNMICKLKYLKGNGRNISRHIDEAAKQANFAVIKLSENAKLDPSRIEKSIKAKMDIHNSLNGVLVLDNNGEIFCEVYRVKAKGAK